MKVAIVHDYLVNKGGAERVVESLHRLYPDAPIYTSLYHPEATYESFAEADIRTSPLQRYSKDPARFRRLLPLFGRAFRNMRLDGYDVVISSSAGFAHRVRVPRGTCHVVYSYSPPRFLWGPQYDVAGVAPRWARPVVPAVLAAMRRGDKRASHNPHFYLAVSAVAAERLRAVYSRTATVIHPPVAVDRFSIAPVTGDYYLLVARLLPHRNVELAVKAFTKMGRKLVVVGDGPTRSALEASAGPSVSFAGAVDEKTLVDLYARCRGLIVPGEEDFGLTPLEANASGRPAIALRAAGAMETLIDGVTGIHFAPATPAALAMAVEQAERSTFDPVALRAHADSFAESVFHGRVRAFVERSTESCLTCARHRRRASRAALVPVREVGA